MYAFYVTIKESMLIYLRLLLIELLKAVTVVIPLGTYVFNGYI